MYHTHTRIFRITQNAIEQQLIEEAARILSSGGLVAFPTETVYGLGANALDSKALERIFVAKERPFSDPLIVHIAETSQMAAVAADIPELAWRLSEEFWPGPLTLVLRRGIKVSNLVSAGKDTIAIRSPNHPIAQALIRAANLPVAAPSANRFSRPSPTTAQHVLDDLEGRVDILLDGGPCLIGLESTVLDLLSDPPVILRPGGLPIERIQQIIPKVEVQAHYLQGNSEINAASPGMLLKHYSPEARLLLITGSPGAVQTKIVALTNEFLRAKLKVGILTTEEDASVYKHYQVQLQTLGSRSKLEQIGANLFAAIRALDQEKVDVILVGELDLEGLGLAIRDRLTRAANGQVIQAEE